MLPEMRIYTTPNDIRYLLVEHEEVISDVIRRDGVWGSQYLTVAEKILSKSDPGRVIDVGAGFGTFTVPLAVTFDGVHSFDAIEPLPKINMQLSANILLNNLDNVNVHKFVAANTNSRAVEFSALDFNRSANHGSFSFNTKFDSIRGISPNDRKDVYEYRKIDDLNFANVRLIKVTTPGMEFDVFMGMYETLAASNWPPVIFESWTTEWYKEERAKAMDFFAGRGYEHYLVIDDHVVAFKTKSQADYFSSDAVAPTKEVKKEQSGEFVFSVQEHDREDVLKNQVGATSL
jgi:FkbM family methyltransferase